MRHLIVEPLRQQDQTEVNEDLPAALLTTIDEGIAYFKAGGEGVSFDTLLEHLERIDAGA